jgi:dTDP-4-dehydrorhamnose 3,5-epimerase
MTFEETSLKGSFVIKIDCNEDNRGWFARTYCKNEFTQIGFSGEWVQLNHSYTKKKGTIRGMHFQKFPFMEIKLVRCIAGRVMDVIIDLREDSLTFLQYCRVELSAQNKKMIYIPHGFAHGFQCLTGDCELIYHHSEYYQPGFEDGIRYNDPMLNINWETGINDISERDLNHPLLDSNFKGLKSKQ